jgi:hypothetical protein
MQKMWPQLESVLKEDQKAASGKKKTSKKKKIKAES